MRRTIISSVLGAFLVSLLTGTGWAMDLQTAKEQGLLGETASCYLALVQNNPEAAKVAASVNARRKAEYQSIAQKNGIALKDVEQLAGKKAIDKTPKGQFVQADGKWVKK